MKNKIFLVSLFAMLAIVLLCSLNVINVVKADGTIIFSDDFQSGNLNAWTQFRGTLTNNSQTTNNGELYSVESVVTAGSIGNLYYHPLSPSLITNPMDLREYVYINSTTEPTESGDYYQVGGFSTSTGPNIGDGELIAINVAGTVYWGVYYRDTSNSMGFSFAISSDNKTSDAHPVSIGWNSVELKQLTGTAGQGNGEEQLFLNSALIVDAKNVWNFDRTPANVIIGGSQSAEPSDTWNYYIADIVVSSTGIGSIQNSLTMQTNYGTVSPANGTYDELSTQTITATPPTANPGERYVWQGWTGTGLGSYTGTGSLSSDQISYTTSVTMNSNITETALWKHQFQLTILSPYGSTIGDLTWYDAGSSAYAAVTPTTVAGTSGTQYVFTGWSGAASGTASTSNAIVMNGPETATANWQTQYLLTVSSAHGTTGGAGWYNSGSSAYATIDSLTALGTSETQYLFTGWSGTASGTALTSNAITMNGPKTATTTWQTQYNLTITQSGAGSDFSGIVMTVNGTNYGTAGFTTWANTSDVYTFSYVASPLVVAADSEQYLLTGVSGNSSAISVTVSQPTTVTGAYKTQYYLTVSSPYDSPSPTSGWFDNNTSITGYVSSPSSGYSCSGWSGTGSVPASGGTSVVSFTITAPSTLTWNWAASTSTSSSTYTSTSTSTSSTSPTPTPTPKPNNSPTPTPHPTASTTPTPSNSSPTPSSQSDQSLSVYPNIYGIAIALVIIVIVAVTVAVLVSRKRKTKTQ